MYQQTFVVNFIICHKDQMKDYKDFFYSYSSTIYFKAVDNVMQTILFPQLAGMNASSIFK